MSRPVHTGIHDFGPRCAEPRCRVCDLLALACVGRQCSGIRNILGRPIAEDQDLQHETPPEGDAEMTSVEARGGPARRPVSVSSAGASGRRAAGALLTGQRQDGPIQVPAPAQYPEAVSRAASGFNRRRGISPASPAQRAHVKAKACIVTADDSLVHPAHLIDRSLLTVGQDDPRAVVPLRPDIHRLYDSTAGYDLLPFLEPHYRVELAFAVERFGLLPTLRRVTGRRWVPETTT